MILRVLKECKPVAAVDQLPAFRRGVLSQEEALDMDRRFQCGFESDFLGHISKANEKAEEGRLTVADAESLTEPLVGGDVAPALVDTADAQEVGWLRGSERIVGHLEGGGVNRCYANF